MCLAVCSIFIEQMEASASNWLVTVTNLTASFNVRDSPHPATDTGVKAAHGGWGGGGGGGVIIPVYLFSASHRGGRPGDCMHKTWRECWDNNGLNNPTYCLRTCSSTAGQPGFRFYYRKWLQCLSCSTDHYTHLQCVVGEMMVVLLQLVFDPRHD